jgi:hypothetical protein
MHALPLLAVLVNPYLLLFRSVGQQAASGSRFGDEPNPEARQHFAEHRASEPARSR